MAAPGPVTFAELVAVGIDLGGTAGSGLTDRLYARLPDAYRALDADHDLALYRYLAAIVDVADALELAGDAIDYVPADEGGPAGDTSILVDPAQTFAPAWLAQAVGVDLDRAAPGASPFDADARAAIADARNGWRAGSAASLAAAGARALTGSRTIIIRDHLDPDPFVITVSTRVSETPDGMLLGRYLEAVRPAGHAYAFNNTVGSWDGIEAAQDGITALDTVAPTWDDVEAL